MSDCLSDLTELHSAAWCGRLLLLKNLLRVGENVNLLTSLHDTPLHFACLAGNTSCAKSLLEAGANINSVNINLKTPLYNACCSGSLNCCKLLMSRGAKDLEFHSCLCAAIQHNNLDCAKELIDCDVTRVDYPDSSPLHYACEENNIDIVKLLLLSGADTKYCSRHGATSFLHTAAEMDKPDLVALFLKFGSCPHYRNSMNMKPRNVACHNSNCYRMLTRAEKTPKKLQDICRIVLFDYLTFLKKPFSKSIQFLDLPPIIIDFLLFKVM